MTVYKGLKETDAERVNLVVISGLVVLAMSPYSMPKAIGMRMGCRGYFREKASIWCARWRRFHPIDAKQTDPVTEVQKLCGGAQGVLVAAGSPKAFTKHLGILPEHPSAIYDVPLPAWLI